jgi:thiamine-phosphate pyrophosphorylase
MHRIFYKYYCFIEQNQSQIINLLPKNTSLIYRNYQKPANLNYLINLKKLCKKKNINFFLSNNVKLAIKLDLDGAYIPAFNKSFSHNSYNFKKKFKIIGSAHNLNEIKIKEKQNVSSIFLSSIFKNTKNMKFLGIYKFLNLMKLTKKEIICLGGINEKNIKKIKLIKVNNIASISMFQKLLKNNE